LPLDLHVDALLLTAASELERSQPAAAKVTLDEALRLAGPERLRRPFEEATFRLRVVLREHRELVECRLRAGPRPAARSAPAAGVLVQPLTEREREVLTHLAALLPTEEIAGRMFVSVNTVKTHIRAILRKLAAERRNDAVRRARDLGLL
jgi:LuxR family maltose regulon positive regulatory protein